MDVVGFDAETTKAPRHLPWVGGSYLVSASAVPLSSAQTNSWLFNHPDMVKPQKESIDELKEILFSAKRIVAHNIKFDLLWLLWLGFDIDSLTVYCTQVAEYLIRRQETNRGTLTLEQLSKDYGISDKIDKVKLFWESGYETDEIPSSILTPYCEQDVINCLAIYQRQARQIKDMGITALCTLQFEISKVLAKVEYNGLLINQQKLEEFSNEYGIQITDLDRRITEIIRSKSGVGEADYNISSGEQLSALLYGGTLRQPGKEIVQRVRKDGSIREYERKCTVEIPVKGLGFQHTKDITTSKEGVYKTDIETLKSLKCKESYQREFVKLILERSRLVKLKSTYFDGLSDKLVDSFIHSSMNQTIARTGRLSSSNPNSQNFPRGSTGPVKQIFMTRYP